MNETLQVAVAGIGAWTRGAPDWPALRSVLLGECGLSGDAPDSPMARALPAAERRRAPESVRLAAEVAAQACAMANLDPARLPCVFASVHGELAITDYVCATLALAPLELSPTRFHNSVLNAPAGYWTIAAGCTAASSAVTAHHRSFATGMLEAATFACTEDTPVLLVACDVASAGPLAAMTRTTLAFGAGLVLTPDTNAGARIGLTLDEGSLANAPAPASPALQPVAADNPCNAHALALLAALTGRSPGRFSLPLSSGLSLDMEITP